MNKLFAFLPEQASTFAASVDNLYLYLIAITVVFSVLIFSVVGVFAVLYRRKSDDERPADIHGNNLLEIIWTVIPLIVALSIFVAGASLFFKMYRVPADATEIFVVAKQWMWKIQHPEGQREINELHVPVNRKVKLKMTSEDVIHSFFVPAFRMKMDVVPGRYTEAWFEASKPGRYHLFCAEFCGTEHSGMIGSIIVMKEEEYEAWLSGKTAAPSAAPEAQGNMAEQGKALFQQLRCNTCHAPENWAQGPDLAGVYGKTVKLADGSSVKADETYLRESILKPAAKIAAGYSALMPTYKGQVNEEQIMALIAYIKSLQQNEKIK